MTTTIAQHNAAYIQARFKEPGGTAKLTAVVSDGLIELKDHNNPVGVIRVSKSGKTLGVWLDGNKVGGSVRSLDAAIARLQGAVSNRNYLQLRNSLVAQGYA